MFRCAGGPHDLETTLSALNRSTAHFVRYMMFNTFVGETPTVCPGPPGSGGLVIKAPFDVLTRVLEDYLLQTFPERVTCSSSYHPWYEDLTVSVQES